jgi:hypothetical protein
VAPFGRRRRLIEPQGIDVITIGFQEAISESEELARWAVQALKRINREGGYPDFVVDRSDARAERFEDDGRTLVLPLNYPKKCYCVINETGGATLMLADDY